MKGKVLAAVIYAATAVVMANWIDYALRPEQPYGHLGLARIALLGCAFLLLGCIISLFRLRYGVIVGLVAAGVSWPYFGLLAISLPWRNIMWLTRIHLHGADQVAAVLGLMVATIYSLIQLRRSNLILPDPRT